MEMVGKDLNSVKKIFLLLIKYIPIVQLFCFLLNNILYYFDYCRSFTYLLDFILGNSMLTTLLMIVTSYTFKFCNWHRIIILTNFIALSIAMVDSVFGINISDILLLLIYHGIVAIGVSISVKLYLNNKNVTQD